MTEIKPTPDIYESTWYLVPNDKRPSSLLNNHKPSSSESLFVVKQGWQLEIVGLDAMGRLNIQDLDISEPMMFSCLS